MSLHRAILGRRQSAYPRGISIITWLLAQTTQKSGRGLYTEGAGASFVDSAGVLELTSDGAWYCTC